MKVSRETLAVVGVGVLIVLAWQAIVVIGDYPPFLLPGPLVVLERFARALAQGTIAPHLATTLVEVTLGLLVGVTTGLGIGLLLARSPLAERLLSPYIVAAQATPILALAPLLVLWFGSGLVSKVLVVALICFFPMAVATTVGLRSVDSRLIELVRSLRATRRQLLATIEVPAALPQMLGGLRISVTLAVVGAIVAEWVGGERGLGVLINPGTREPLRHATPVRDTADHRAPRRGALPRRRPRRAMPPRAARLSPPAPDPRPPPAAGQAVAGVVDLAPGRRPRGADRMGSYPPGSTTSSPRQSYRLGPSGTHPAE